MPRHTQGRRSGQKGKSMKRKRHWHRKGKTAAVEQGARAVWDLTRKYPDEKGAA